MRRTIRKIAFGLPAIMLAAALAVGASGTAAHATLGAIPIKQVPIANGWYWDYCESSSYKMEWIYLENTDTYCGDAGPGGTVLGFASMRTVSATQHPWEVCTYQAVTYFEETVDPAAPDGSSTGNLFTQHVGPGNVCVRGTADRVRKFQAYIGLFNWRSDWWPPYPA